MHKAFSEAIRGGALPKLRVLDLKINPITPHRVRPAADATWPWRPSCSWHFGAQLPSPLGDCSNLYCSRSSTTVTLTVSCFAETC